MRVGKVFLSKRVPLIFAIAFLLFPGISIANVAAPTYKGGLGDSSDIHIRYSKLSKDEIHFAKQAQYLNELLHLALSKSVVNFTTEAVIIPHVVTSRRAKLLKDNLFDVTWMHTNKKLELSSLPVRIPLLKGLLGLRVFFVRQAELNLFSNIQSVEQLKIPVVGQGDNWTDTRILRLNNFNLVTAMNTDSLMEMLLHARFDFFPRSVLEIWAEKTLYNSDTIVIEPTIALSYPTALYFFVANDNKKLAKFIEDGLNKAIDDGSFDKLFNRYFSEDIARVNLAERRIFKIEAFDESAILPLSRKELWFSNPAL